MSWDEFDFVVIGGGLAGALTVDRMSSSGKRVAWFDRQLSSSSTLTGAGIMNPITGRKFVYSWLFDRFEAQAIKTYQDLESDPYPILHRLCILKGLATPGDVNNWCLRLGEAPFDRYMQEPETPEALPFLREVHQLGRIDPVYRVDMTNVVQAVAAKWGRPHHGILTGTRQLDIQGRQEEIPDHLPVVLTTGSPVQKVGGLDLPLTPYQGQALLIRSADLPTDRIIHHKLKVVPYGGDTFWVGTFDQWEDLSDQPTEEGHRVIIDTLDRYFDIHYEVIGQVSGIRPASKTRRPFVGELPGYSQTFVINGLGTKGASLAPLMVKTLCDFLLFDVAIPAEFSLPAG